jgi:hypothetical protein
VDAAFERRQETSALLQVTAGNVHLNCHFFCAEEIEFDLDPPELEGEQGLQAVLAFIRGPGERDRRARN